MIMKMQAYDLKVVYKPGKQMYIPDTLSRVPIDDNDASDIISNLDEEIRIHGISLVKSLSVSKEKL